MLEEGVRELIANNTAPLTPDLSSNGRILVIQSETDGKYAYESESSEGFII